MVAPFGSAACRSLEFRCCGSSGRESTWRWRRWGVAVGGGGSGGFSVGSVERVLFVFQLARTKFIQLLVNFLFSSRQLSHSSPCCDPPCLSRRNHYDAGTDLEIDLSPHPHQTSRAPTPP